MTDSLVSEYIWRRGISDTGDYDVVIFNSTYRDLHDYPANLKPFFFFFHQMASILAGGSGGPSWRRLVCINVRIKLICFHVIVLQVQVADAGTQVEFFPQVWEGGKAWDVWVTPPGGDVRSPARLAAPFWASPNKVHCILMRNTWQRSKFKLRGYNME